MTIISETERRLVAPRLTRMRQLQDSGAWADMTHSEAYDAVYLKEPWPGHKQERLANIARATNDR